MPKIDKRLAEKVLEEAVQEARILADNSPWLDEIKNFREAVLATSQARTMMAALGTALLAKATYIKHDPFLLTEPGKGRDRYSARTFCKDVLAHNRGKFAIDLMVQGSDPFASNTYLRQERISRSLGVHRLAKPALEKLCDLLERLSRVKTDQEAKEALRAFLRVQVAQARKVTITSEVGERLTESEFLRIVTEWVAVDSNYGARAQAVAAGILDAMVGEERVLFSPLVHDPSRNHPGDVAVLKVAGGKAIERTIEVKDKVVNERVVEKFVDKAYDKKILVTGYLAIAKGQTPLDTETLERYARARRVRLGVYVGWERFVREAMYWSNADSLCVGLAFRRVLIRAGMFAEIPGSAIAELTTQGN